jgi:hypothetical protein
MCGKSDALKVRREAVQKATADLQSGTRLVYSPTDEAAKALHSVGKRLASFLERIA